MKPTIKSFYTECLNCNMDSISYILEKEGDRISIQLHCHYCGFRKQQNYFSLEELNKKDDGVYSFRIDGLRKED